MPLSTPPALSIVASIPLSPLSLSQELTSNKRTITQRRVQFTTLNFTTTFIQWTSSTLSMTPLQPTLYTTSMYFSTLSPTVLATPATLQEVPSTSCPFHHHTQPILTGTANRFDVAAITDRHSETPTPRRCHNPNHPIRHSPSLITFSVKTFCHEHFKINYDFPFRLFVFSFYPMLSLFSLIGTRKAAPSGPGARQRSS